MASMGAVGGIQARVHLPRRTSLRAGAGRPTGASLVRNAGGHASASASRGLSLKGIAVSLRATSFTQDVGAFRCHNVATRQVNSRQVTKCQEEGGDPSALVMPSAPSGPPKLWARMASVLPYFIPWIDMLGLIFPLLYSFPQWAVFFYMPMWLLVVYGAHMLVPLIIFFAIYLCIVRNNKMPHFLRFNCLQAVLIDIAGMLVTLLDMYMPGELSLTLFKTLFCGIAATSMLYAIFYCMFCAIFGIYAEIPEISNAVYIQVQQASSGQ
mmetsp:Transcript_36262/g.114425  ORF Transcript_36262/g.114425 Transcript_36262/m.114425 type:complete len:267 (+) Transcript_36262:27-827(+)